MIIKKKFSKMRGSRGQVLVFGLMLTIVMLMFTFTVMNVAKIVKERILMQNAADNAAMAIAIIRARALNRLGRANYNLEGTAGTLSAIENWYFAQCVGWANTIARGQGYDYSGENTGAEGVDIIANPSLGLNANPGGWIEQGEGFYNQKVVVEVYKTAGHPTMAGFPVGKGFLTLPTFEIRARAAAAVYNVKGPMFPPAGWAPATSAEAKTFYCTDANPYTHKPGLWPPAAPYKDAHNGGWEAHLVQIGGGYEH